jgi:hypothetical protein
MTVSPRRAAEARVKAGLVPPIREPLPPEKAPRRCHGCDTPLDPVMADAGETLHPNCDPPRQERKRGRRSPR